MGTGQLKINHIISNREVYFHIAFWGLYFFSIHSDWKDNWFDRNLRPESISQVAILVVPLFFYLNALYLIPKYFNRAKWPYYIFVTALTLLGIECLRVLLYLSFNGIDESFYLSFIREFKSYDNLVLGRLNPLLICLQFSLIYKLTRDWLLNDNLNDSMREDLKITMLFWLFFSPFVVFTAIYSENYISNILFLVLGVVLITVDVFLVSYILLPKLLFKKRYFFFFLAFLFVQFAVTLIQQSVLGNKGILGTSDDFLMNWVTATIENVKVMAILLGLILSRKYYGSQNRILRIEKEKKENELKWLKSQINPHFLFNNLNALDDLIQRNTPKAKEYLHKLSNTYRYLIATAEKDLVGLNEEWLLIDDYIYLLKERYGDAYTFSKHCNLKNLDDYLIPPATLQSLIENAVKHNQGSIKKPLLVNIRVLTDGITISHSKRPKFKVNNSLGTGLKNLKSRFKLLSDKEVIIIDTDIFSVRLPLIKKLK